MRYKSKITIRSVSNQTAKKEIGNFFIKRSAKGIKRVDVGDISSALGLPGGQVEKILYDFIKEGRVERV